MIAELGEGRIGQVELRDGSFTAELAGVAALLDRPVCEATSPECRAELGDARCRVAMAGRRRFVARDVRLRRYAADGRCRRAGRQRLWQRAAALDRRGQFGAGKRDRRVGRRDADAARAAACSIPCGALVELIEGCDKSIATCAARFANAANFRGEPYLPGIDLLTRYPGA